MKFKKGSLWPSCLGGAAISDAAGSGNTLKILTADGQVLRFPELWSMTVADLLAYTAHPHHMVCEGNPKDFLLHHSRLTKLSSALDDDSSYDTESTSDRSETNSFTTSPARRSFGSLAAAATGSRSGRSRSRSRGSPGSIVGLSPLTRMPSLGSPMMKRFFLGAGERKDLLGGFLGSPIQRLRAFGRSRHSSGETLHGGGLSPSQMSRNAMSDMESEVGSEDGSCCDFQLPKFERGRILSLDTELESGRVYYLVPLPRLLPDNGTDSDANLAWGPPCPAPKCSCLKASTAKRLQLDSKKSSKHSRPAICGSMRCNMSHGLVIMGSTNRSSKINPQDSEWESDFSGEMSRRGASTISHSGDLNSLKRYSFSSDARGHLAARFRNQLAAYRSEEELVRDEMAAKVARAQYRIPPAYCFRSPWKLELPIIIEGMMAVHDDKSSSRSSRSSNNRSGKEKSPKAGIRSPEMHWPSPFPQHHPPGLRSNRSPGRKNHSPGRRGRKHFLVYQAQSPHSPSLTSQSPIRFARTSPHTRLLERQLIDSPLHLPATSPDRFHAIPPKFQLSSPDRSPAAAAAAAGLRGGAGYPPHFQLSSPERASFTHNNLNPPSYRQTHPAYSSHRQTETFRLSETPSAHRPFAPEYYSDPASLYYRSNGGSHSLRSGSSLNHQQQQQGVQPWQSPPSGVNFFISGKTWQICSPQRSEAAATYSPTPGGARPWKAVGSPGAGAGAGASYLPRPGPPESPGLARDVFTPSSQAWPNPAPRSSLEPVGTSREMLNAAQLGMVQQGSNGRFRSSPAWKDVRQISPGRPGGQVGWGGSPGHNGIYRSSTPAYAGYGGPTW